MTRKQRANRQRGVVLIAVAWGVLVLAAMAFGFATLVRSGTEELRARKEQMQAHYLARGAVYRAIPFVKGASTAQVANPFGSQSRIEWDEAGARVSVDVVDETGKLDLNTAPPEMLQSLFMNLGMEFQSAHDLVAAIEDWRDPDDDTRSGGAESLYYLGLPQPYRPANRNFRSVEELLLVRDVTPEMFYGGYRVLDDDRVERKLGLMDCLTVYSHAASVNINYAPLPVLMSVPHISPTTIDFIMQSRRTRWFGSISEFTHDYPVLLDGETLSHLSAGLGSTYSLIASGTTPSGITARVRAVVQVGGLDRVDMDGQRRIPGPPFLILSWDDSYVR